MALIEIHSLGFRQTYLSNYLFGQNKNEKKKHKLLFQRGSHLLMPVFSLMVSLAPCAFCFSCCPPYSICFPKNYLFTNFSEFSNCFTKRYKRIRKENKPLEQIPQQIGQHWRPCPSSCLPSPTTILVTSNININPNH